MDSNLDIFRSCERFRKCTQPAFWLAALYAVTNVLAERPKYGARATLFRHNRYQLSDLHLKPNYCNGDEKKCF